MSQKRRKNKKNKRKNLLINILAGFLILLSLALIFNSKIRDIFMILNTNKYQVSQVTKENIEKNQETEGNFDFDSVKALSSEAVLSAQWNSQQLPVIGGIAIPELEMNLPIEPNVVGTEFATRHAMIDFSGSKPTATIIAAGIATAVPKPAIPSMKAPKPHASNNASTRVSDVTEESMVLIVSIAFVCTTKL